MTSRPPTLTLFPYTTLFRSERERELRRHERTARAGIVTRANGAVHAAPKSRERGRAGGTQRGDRKSTRLNSSHMSISYAVFCLKKKKRQNNRLVFST